MIKHMRINRRPEGAMEASLVIKELLDMVTDPAGYPLDVFVLEAGDDPDDIHATLEDAGRFDGKSLYDRQDG